MADISKFWQAYRPEFATSARTSTKVCRWASGAATPWGCCSCCSLDCGNGPSAGRAVTSDEGSEVENDASGEPGIVTSGLSVSILPSSVGTLHLNRHIV